MIWIFVLCTLLNVLISTVKTIVTISGSKLSAAIWNAVSFGLYTYIVILTANSSLTIVEKIAITAVCNFIGVYGIKFLEEKLRKDRLWKIEMTVPAENRERLVNVLATANIPYNYIEGIGKYNIVNAYTATQAQTKIVRAAAESTGAKLFASETKLTH